MLKKVMSPIFIVLVLLAGCGKRAVHIEKEQHIKKQALRQFEARIDGVECAQCAKDAAQLFKAIDGIERADFIVPSHDYEQGYMRFYYDMQAENIDIVALDAMLHEEGFELLSLSGVFHITPVKCDGKQCVVFNQDLVLPVRMGNELNLIRSLGSNFISARFALGEVVRQAQESFVFVLHSTDI